MKSPCCSGFLSAGESISGPKNVPLTFKEQKPPRSIQELLLNTKISGINGQTTLLFCFRSHARTLWGSSFIKELALQHGVAMRVSKHVIVSCKGPIESLTNKRQGNAKIGRKKQGKKKQNTYFETSRLTREKQTLFDGPSKHRKKIGT